MTWIAGAMLFGKNRGGGIISQFNQSVDKLHTSTATPGFQEIARSKRSLLIVAARAGCGSGAGAGDGNGAVDGAAAVEIVVADHNRIHQ